MSVDARADEPPSEPETRAPAAVVATYRTPDGKSRAAIDRTTLEAWRAFRTRRGQLPPAAQALERLVQLEWLATEAEAEGMDAEPAVAFALDRVDHEHWWRALQNHLSADIVVSEAAVRERFAARQSHFVRPPTVRLQNIFLRFPSDADDATIDAIRAQMTSIRASLVAGADFATVALAHSDSQSRFRGGVIGYVHAEQLPPTVATAVMHLEPGALSEPVEGDDGITLFRCDARAPARNVPFAEARPQLERVLEADAFEDRWSARQATLLATAAPTIDWTVIADPQAATKRAANGSGWQLTRQQLAWLVEGDPATRARTKVKNAIEQFAMQTKAVDETRRLGLHDDPHLRNRWRWKRRQALATEAVRRRVEAAMTPLDDQAIRAFWQANQDRFQRPTRYALSAIRMALAPADERASYDRAHDVADRLRAGTVTFEAASAEHSNLPSASTGGSMGWVDRPGLAPQPNLFKTIERLGIGEISKVVEQDGQLWILRLDAREAARRQTFDEARTAAENRLGNERVRALQTRIEAEILTAADLQIEASAVP